MFDRKSENRHRAVEAVEAVESVSEAGGVRVGVGAIRGGYRVS